MQDNKPKAIYTHCYGHTLNLAACDVVKANKLLSDALDVTYEITKLVKFSTKRESMFKRIKSELSVADLGGFHRFQLNPPFTWKLHYSVIQDNKQ